MNEAQSPSPAAPARPAGDRRTTIRTLSLIAAVCIAPVAMSYAVYYLFPRERQVNYGTLLATAPAPPLDGYRADGMPFRLEELRGKWVLLTAGGSSCDAACERSLYATRQARTMQGKDQDRVVRTLLLAGEAPPSTEVQARHPGLVVVRDPAGAAAYVGAAGATYLIDPLGNLVLRYPEDPDIKGVAKDLGRLLKASRIG